MKKYSEIRAGDRFYSTCSTSNKVDEYLGFSRVRNVFLEHRSKGGHRVISGRATLSRMEGEFIRMGQVYGDHIIFTGTDGDPGRGYGNTRFLKPLHTDEVLKLQFTVSAKEDIDGDWEDSSRL